MARSTSPCAQSTFAASRLFLVEPHEESLPAESVRIAQVVVSIPDGVTIAVAQAGSFLAGEVLYAGMLGVARRVIVAPDERLAAQKREHVVRVLEAFDVRFLLQAHQPSASQAVFSAPHWKMAE